MIQYLSTGSRHLSAQDSPSNVLSLAAYLIHVEFFFFEISAAAKAMSWSLQTFVHRISRTAFDLVDSVSKRTKSGNGSISRFAGVPVVEVAA